MDHRQTIPSINRLAAMVGEQVGEIPHEAAVILARGLAQQLRENPGQEVDSPWLASQLAPLLNPGPQPTINGTGILLHTNQGRAPLDRDLILQALDRVCGYTDLELNLDKGKRGHRDRHFARLARMVWGVEDATLVNNAAAAVCVAIAALGELRETVVSRGELIEIGGSFRLPDIMRMAGTKLVEVGTTNKTHIEDYVWGIGPNTGCLFKTHTSNFRIEGFTAEVTLAELVELGRVRKIPVVMDLGSGLSQSLPFPKLPEPSIEDYLKARPDLLIFSGDKLFGSIQAGIILGKRHAVRAVRQHPMMRLVRQDKLSISIICHQLRETFLGKPNPLSQLANTPLAELRARAQLLAAGFSNEVVSVVDDVSFLGGGSLPQEKQPSVSLQIKVKKVDGFARQLRLGNPPIIGYVRNDHFLINMASLFPQQDQLVGQALKSYLPG